MIIMQIECLIIIEGVIIRSLPIHPFSTSPLTIIYFYFSCVLFLLHSLTYFYSFLSFSLFSLLLFLCQHCRLDFSFVSYVFLFCLSILTLLHHLPCFCLPSLEIFYCLFPLRSVHSSSSFYFLSSLLLFTFHAWPLFVSLLSILPLAFLYSSPFFLYPFKSSLSSFPLLSSFLPLRFLSTHYYIYFKINPF